MNLDLNQLFNYKPSSEGLKALMKNYTNEIKKDEDTLKEFRAIKTKYERHATPDLQVPYDKILKENKDYESLLTLAANCSEIQKEIINYNRKHKEFFVSQIDIKRIKKLQEFNDDTFVVLNSAQQAWEKLNQIDLVFLQQGKNTFQIYMNNLLETTFKNFEAPNNNVLATVLSFLKMPIKIKRKQGNEQEGEDQENVELELTKDQQDRIANYLSKLVQIDGAMTGLMGEKTYFNRVLTDSIISSINFHFLGEKETNEPSQPQWLFQYLQEIFEQNVSKYASLFSNTNSKIESNITTFIMTFYSRVCLNTILLRFRQDKEILLDDQDLLLNFVQSLEIFESCIAKFVETFSSKKNVIPITLFQSLFLIFQQKERYLPQILEKILLSNEEGVLNSLIQKELSVFQQKVIKELDKVDIKELSLKDCSEKNFEVFSVVEDYTILYSKIVHKYTHIKDETLRNKLKDIFHKNFFSVFISSLQTVFNQIYDNTQEITFKLLEYFRKVYEILKFYQAKNPFGGSEQDIKLLKEFKSQCIEGVLTKSMDPITKNTLKEIKRLINSTYFKYFTHPKQLEDNELQLDEIRAVVQENLVVNIQLLKKQIGNKSLKFILKKYLNDFADFVINSIFKGYTKFSLFGIEFLIHDVFATALQCLQIPLENINLNIFDNIKEKLLEIEKCLLMDKAKLQLILNTELDTILTSLHFKILKRQELLILEKVNLIKI